MAALPENFVRAYLEIEGGGKLDCYFNPTEYSIAKTNTWEAEKVNGKSSPNQKFTSGNPRKMELSLLFDQTMPPYTMSVGDATAMLLDAMETPSGQNAGAPTSAPPASRYSKPAMAGGRWTLPRSISRTWSSWMSVCRASMAFRRRGP